MAVNLSAPAVVSSFWTSFKATVIGKNLLVQYDDDGIIYTIFALDGPSLLYECVIYKGTVPDSLANNGYSQVQNDSDKSDFETNFKPTANQSIQEVRSFTSTITSVAASVSNVILLSSNMDRLGATIWNESTTATLYVKLGTTASTSSYTARLFPNGYFELPYGYIGEVDGIWDSASGFARITELE